MRWLNRFISTFTGKEAIVGRLNAPLFGALCRGERHLWHGTVNLPQIDQPVTVHVHGKVDGPTDWQRQMFREMIERFPALRLAMEQPLTAEYERGRQAGEFKSASETSGIWSVCSLCAIEINGEDAGITFSFNHEVKGGNEHGLNVRIKDWRVIEVAVE